ncbi:hypothetical protein Tco_0920407, partial [Tanacetum coccineum]
VNFDLSQNLIVSYDPKATALAQPLSSQPKSFAIERANEVQAPITCYWMLLAGDLRYHHLSDLQYHHGKVGSFEFLMLAQGINQVVVLEVVDGTGHPLSLLVKMSPMVSHQQINIIPEKSW